MHRVKKRVVKAGSSLLRSRSGVSTTPAGVQAAAVAVLVKHQIQAGMQDFKEKKPADLLRLETNADMNLPEIIGSRSFPLLSRQAMF